MTEQNRGTTRRRVLAAAASTGASLSACERSPGCRRPRRRTGPLRIAGTGVNQFKELADKCKEDLGFTVQYTSLVSDDVVKRA